MKNKIQIFAEVITDYTNEETGEISIDCYPDTNPNSENARVIATITIDGEIISNIGKTNPEVKSSDFDCILVKNAIAEVQEEQKKRKQLLIDECLELIKEQCASGDVTAIDELLMFCPAVNLKGYLCID
ncbi:MAG TPA: hypothetical protein VIH28_07025 [Ignavibacteriaceae bacterium]